MQKDSKKFLYDLLLTPSPSGFEQKIQKVVKKRISPYADEIYVDVHGNLIAAYNPKGKIKVMLAGHCDQIGMMVTHIDDQGYIYCNQIGGIDPTVLPGTQVTIYAKSGPIDGVIGFRPVHLTPAADRGKPIEFSKAWIDIGTNSGDEVKKLVSNGDPITFRLGVTEVGEDKIVSPGCDDKVGVYVVMEAMRLVSTKVTGPKKKNFPVALFSVSTVQEEIGLRGARTSSYGIDPLVGIAVDVTHASDNPGAEAKKIGTMKLGAGAGIARGPNINPILEKLLIETAKTKKIPIQTYASPGATGTDANAIQISRSGVATALVSLPNRYMHTPVEMVDLNDLDIAAKLLAETIMSISSKMDFIPF